ncbi:MAG: hypothetical protein WBW06_00465 [Xanthobacteraceae bacterium]|jgi:hypothetical protein
MKIKVRQGVGKEKEDSYCIARARQILVSILQRLLGASPRNLRRTPTLLHRDARQTLPSEDADQNQA